MKVQGYIGKVENRRQSRLSDRIVDAVTGSIRRDELIGMVLDGVSKVLVGIGLISMIVITIIA
jgi:hypothetical protein